MQEENQNAENAEETKEEKKEGKLSGFFKKVSQKFDEATYDARLKSDFDKKHKKYTVYTGTSVFAPSPEIAAEEHLEDGYIVMLDSDDCIKAGCLIENALTGEVRHVAAVERTALTVEFEGKSEERKATKITLGEKAEKVDVIKVGENFYLK